jgi:hypothetical protein
MWASWLGAAALAAGVLVWSTPAHAERPSWQLRFERERPAILRAIEGVPGPAGYEYETHYDRRRMLLGSLGLGIGTGIQLLAVSSDGFEGGELIPCAGVFLGDYGKSRDDSGWVDTSQFARAFLSIPICALFLGGAIELGRGLADPRPVWVRRETKRGSVRVSGIITGQEARLHAIGYF